MIFFILRETKGTKGSLMATQLSHLKERNSIWFLLSWGEDPPLKHCQREKDAKSKYLYTSLGTKPQQTTIGQQTDYKLNK